MLRLYERLLASHPPGSAVAELDGEHVLGFGIAVERERTWFLGFLFVEPGLQAGGIGRRLLERILPATGRRRLAGRWRRAGDVCRGHPADLDGPLRLARHATARPDLPARRLAAPGGPAPAAGERRGRALRATGDHRRRRVAGRGRWPRSTWRRSAIRRDIDHRDDRAEGRRGILFRDRGDGRAVGYGYVQPSGRLGPAYVTDADLLEGVLSDLIGRAAAGRRLAVRGARCLGCHGAAPASRAALRRAAHRPLCERAVPGGGGLPAAQLRATVIGWSSTPGRSSSAAGSAARASPTTSRSSAGPTSCCSTAPA